MAVIDVQVHAYERNHPGRPWVGQLHGPQSADGEEMVTAMDAVAGDVVWIHDRVFPDDISISFQILII